MSVVSWLPKGGAERSAPVHRGCFQLAWGRRATRLYGSRWTLTGSLSSTVPQLRTCLTTHLRPRSWADYRPDRASSLQKKSKLPCNFWTMLTQCPMSLRCCFSHCLCCFFPLFHFTSYLGIIICFLVRYLRYDDNFLSHYHFRSHRIMSLEVAFRSSTVINHFEQPQTHQKWTQYRNRIKCAQYVQIFFLLNFLVFLIT